MVQIRSDTTGLALHTPLFNRFEGAKPAGLQDLLNDLADILGARRAFTGSAPGVLGWGLAGIGEFTPSSEQDRRRLANQVASVVEAYEPRLERVRVVPVGTGGQFRFNLEADLVQSPGQSIRLHVLAPRQGGALGAEVVVIGVDSE